MSRSEELKKVVKELLRNNNVELKEFMEAVLLRIAGDFWAKKLITQETEKSMHVKGEDTFSLAAKLMNACQASLQQRPEENFPKFIEVLKKYETMEQLAKEMETEFEQARELHNTPLVIRLAGLDKQMGTQDSLAVNVY